MIDSEAQRLRRPLRELEVNEALGRALCRAGEHFYGKTALNSIKVEGLDFNMTAPSCSFCGANFCMPGTTPVEPYNEHVEERDRSAAEAPW